MKTLKLLMLFSFILIFKKGNSQEAQNHNVQVQIPEVAIVDIEGTGGTGIVLNIEAPEEAGKAIDLSNAKDSSLWLNYSSIIGSQTEAIRDIYAKITQGKVPKGLRLRVSASVDAGNGDGNIGTPTSEKTLNKNDKRIIKNIKSAYTGDGVGSGHRLNYRLQFRNNQYNKIDFDQSSTVTILYTITDS